MPMPSSDAFDVSQIAERLRAENGGYEVFHASPGLDLGVYVLVAPEADRQHRFTDYESVSLLVVFDKTQTA